MLPVPSQQSSLSLVLRLLVRFFQNHLDAICAKWKNKQKTYYQSSRIVKKNVPERADPRFPGNMDPDVMC